MKTALNMLFALVAMSFGVSASAQTLAERPEVARGMSWKYHFQDSRFPGVPASDYSFTIKVKEVTPEKILAERIGEDGASTSVVFDGDMNFVATAGRDVYRAFPFPLETGKRWSFEFSSRNATGVSLKNEVTGEVIGTEKVVVPAGTFDATKVVLSRKYVGSNGLARWSGTVTETWCYASSVRNFVKKVSVDTNVSGGKAPTVSELVAYNPATTTLTAESPIEDGEKKNAQQ